MERNNIDDILRLSCSHCKARFKIRHPRPGAGFSCTRCGKKIVLPGKGEEDGEAPNIVKIELHEQPFRWLDKYREEMLPDEERSVTKILPTAPGEADALGKTNRSSRVKKIFADDFQNRVRLLYLISLYTRPGIPGEEGVWIRKLSLQVFMFEGVINEIFDWDYAPSSIMIAEGRIFVNISREGEYDLFSLLIGGYVHNLKLTTSQHLNITAYQVTEKGVRYEERISEGDKRLVEELVTCPLCERRLQVEKRGESFFFTCLSASCNYEKRSTITEAEDLSYFCIPYFPPSLCNFEYRLPYGLQRRLADYLASNPVDNIKDVLEELLYLSKVKVIIGEWLPFGSNLMAALNYKLGSDERVQSAKFTQQVDTSPGGTTINIPESLTLVKVRDYNLASYVDFEALCYLPEDAGIIQIEEFAVHIAFTGCVRYGLEILAINERDQEKVSMDHLPRILVDILQDSTTIMDTLLTSYQKKLMDIIFQEKAQFRDKYFFVLADEIHTFGDHEDANAELTNILSQPRYQNEISQITEEIKESAIFADGTVLIMGSHGSILVTKTPEKYEHLISDFLFIMDLEIFLNNFFTRLFLMNDELNDIQQLIKNCETDPNAIAAVQQKLSRTSGNTILMEELRCYLKEAINIFEKRLEKRRQIYLNVQEVVQAFRIEERTHGLGIRIQDIKKIIRGTQECLQGLTTVTEVISERQMRRIQETLSRNTRNLEEITKTNERSSMSLRILEIILAGGLAFNIMDQFTGEWHLSGQAPLRPLLQQLFDTPGVWLLFSVMLWLLFAFLIFILMRWIEKINSKALATRIKLDLPCNLEALKKFIAGKNIETCNSDVFNISNLMKVHWKESDESQWLGNKPKIELAYDQRNGFLMSALVEVNRPVPAMTNERLQEILLMQLRQAGVFEHIENIEDSK